MFHEWEVITFGKKALNLPGMFFIVFTVLLLAKIVSLKFTCLFSISPIRMQAPKMKGNVFLIFVVSLCLAWDTADSQEMFTEWMNVWSSKFHLLIKLSNKTAAQLKMATDSLKPRTLTLSFPQDLLVLTIFVGSCRHFNSLVDSVAYEWVECIPESEDDLPVVTKDGFQ